MRRYKAPKSKRSSSEWTATDEPRPKCQKAQQWAGKVMASVFRDVRGVIFTDSLEKENTINSEYYIALSESLKAEIAKKRQHMGKENILFHQDSAPSHKSIKTMQNYMN